MVCSQGDLLYVLRPLEVGGSLLVDQNIICARLLLIPHFFNNIQLYSKLYNYCKVSVISVSFDKKPPHAQLQYKLYDKENK